MASGLEEDSTTPGYRFRPDLFLVPPRKESPATRQMINRLMQIAKDAAAEGRESH